ncbi:hypothetical protein K7H22_13635 [Seohaeicola saemankumensis]|uniref:hypothetical protein n=1 Tax=Seohaeicola saemankumensis TaxID=481181 RepID=UPI001E5AECAA|nr:hypothetical protein [Seohaeicola saemankumensis]MCD1627038.1 hypothetical protein [Seohaeicola saemankumensis]
MTYQYTVTVERTVDRVSNELVARNVTADQAIDLLLHIQRNFSDSEKEDAVEEEQEEPEQVPKDEPTAPPKKAKATKKASKPLSYDKDAIVADLRANMPVAEIAAKHKVTK